MWHTGTIDGYWYEAKVYDAGSRHGINSGRVSKLCVCQGEEFNSQTVVYNYDRVLDVDAAPAGLINKIISHCESLPATVALSAE